MSGVETAVLPYDVPNLSEASSSSTDIGSETLSSRSLTQTQPTESQSESETVIQPALLSLLY